MLRIAKPNTVTFALLALAVAWIACHDATFAADKKSNKVTFDEHILPIMKEHCAACHNADKSRGGLVVDNYTALMAGGSSGEVVKPGDADKSRLYLLAAHKATPPMPPKSPAIAAEKQETIQKWIAAGALENSGSKSKIINKPKVEIALSAINKGKPDGPPPMPLAKVNIEPVVRSTRPGATTALASSPWAPLIAAAGQKQVLLYNSDSLDLAGVLPFPEGSIHVLKFSRNGSLLLAGGGRGGKLGRVVVWSVVTGERIFEVGDESDAVLAADISADQTQIAMGGPSKVVRVYSTKDGQLLREIKKHTDWIYSIEFSPDGVLMATGDRSSGLFVWEGFTGREYFNLRGHTAAITDISWRADSNVLATSSEDTTVRLWEMENGGQIKAWGAHGGGALCVRYARDGRLNTCGRDLVTRIWDQNGAQQKIFEAFPDVALKTTFSHDAARVIAGDWSGQLRVWNAADGKQVGNLTTNPASVAERLEAATKDVAAKEVAHGQLVVAAAASQAVALKSASELALAQKNATGTSAAVKMANDELAKAKAEADKATAAVSAAQLQVVAKDVVSKALAEAVAKVKDAAEKAKINPEMASALTKTQQLAAQATGELAVSQKSAADLAVAAKIATDQIVKAQQNVTAAVASANSTPKVLEAKTAEAKALAAKAAADKLAADQGAVTLAEARARVDRLKSSLVAFKPASK